MTKIIQRHDTAANWTTVNPVLAVGEIGIETDTNKMKIGDGTSPYTELPYSDKEIYDELNKKQNKFETLTPINLDIFTKGVVVPPLTYNTNIGGYFTSVSPTIYFDADKIMNYNGNPQFFKDYGYVDIPYELGQIACYSFSYGTSSSLHAGMSAYNIVYGRWVGDDFDVIMAQGTGNHYLRVFPSYEVNSSGSILNSVTLTLNNKRMPINSSNYPSVYGGNQNIFQIINGRIYTYRTPYQGLMYVNIPANVLDRVLSITDILIIPYSANGQNRGYGIQPIYMSENSRVDGTMLFDSGNVAYPDLFPNATASTWNTLFETEFANKNILLQSSNTIEQLSLKYDNNTIGLNSSGQLTYLPTDNVKSSTVTNLVQISQTDYDALATKDANTLYIIT